jgi:hypothetical protein
MPHLCIIRRAALTAALTDAIDGQAYIARSGGLLASETNARINAYHTLSRALIRIEHELSQGQVAGRVAHLTGKG